ncbi:hypothetical protein Ga0100231_024570 [Opitutaceae bacterium TAV4]|nr:hypothetical protein Ga0100231_024570 [Opitutaceae bacterium TAV4]RRK00955.1 hypothetical protein Ga0100230_024645 [Opitutaceae bacterium TAV3]
MHLSFRLVLLSVLSAATLSAASWRSELYPEIGYYPESANLDTGKVLQDLSYAGYHVGEATIPNITGPVYDVTAAPYNADSSGATDATAAIQTAINAAGNAGGGVVFLPVGTYRLSTAGDKNEALLMDKPNVVLRGAGRGQTFLLHASTSMRFKHVIRVKGSSNSAPLAVGNAYAPLSQDLLHSTKTIPVTDTSAFAVGDTVVVRNDITEAWVTEHGADWKSRSDYTENAAKFGPNDWQNEEARSSSPNGLRGLRYRRTVLAVDAANNTLTVDAPVRYSLKLRDNARVVRLTAAPLSEVGLEDFSVGNIQHIGTTWDENDTSKSGTMGYDVTGCFFIKFERVRDCWARRISSYQPSGNTTTAHILSGGISAEDSTHVTIERCAFGRPEYGGGGGNGYMFQLYNTGESLIQHCEARFARHGFQITGIGAAGNVIHNCFDALTGHATGGPNAPAGGYATGGLASDFHAHLSQANLIDVCTTLNSRFEARFRGPSGSISHGLSAIHSIFWNLEGTATNDTDWPSWQPVVLSEQARFGYAIGSRGPRPNLQRRSHPEVNVLTTPEDHFEGQGLGDTLQPFSLFLDQRARRLSSQGNTNFSNDFNDYTSGSALPLSYTLNGWSPQTAPQTTDDGNTLFSRIVTDSGNHFGSGTENRYLRVADTSNANGTASYGNYNFLLSTASNALGGESDSGMLAFDFYEPENAAAQGIGWMLRLGNGWAANGNTVFALCIGQGGVRRVTGTNNVPDTSATLGEFSQNQKHTLRIVFNSSAETLVYNGGSVATGTMDVWLDNTKIASGVAGSGGKGSDWTNETAPVTINNFNITRNPANGSATSDFVGEILLDNFSLTDEAVIPPLSGVGDDETEDPETPGEPEIPEEPGSALPPQPVEALSIRAHGSAGTFGIPVQFWVDDFDEPLEPPSVECRFGDELTFVVEFDKAVASVGAAEVVIGEGEVELPVEIVDYQAVVTVTGVANAQVLKIQLQNIIAEDGGMLDAVSLTAGILPGDLNGDGNINMVDVNLSRSRLGTSVDASGFHFDVTCDGTINMADVNRERSVLSLGIPRLPVGDWGVGGDSRSVAYNSGTRDSRYPQIWAEQLLQGAITIKKDNLSSKGGISSDQFVATYLTPLVNKPTVGSIVLISANDRNMGISVAKGKTNINTIIAAHQTAGKALILLNEYPFQTYVGDSDPAVKGAKLADHLAIRDYIDTKHDPANGVWVANIWDAMTTEPRGFVTREGYLKTDNVHPTPRGAAAMAKAIFSATRHSFQNYTQLFERPNALYNPNDWSGWTLPALPAGASIGDEVIDGVAVRKVIFNNVTGTSGVVVQFNGPVSLHGFVPGTSKVDSVIGYEVRPGLTGIAAVSMITNSKSGWFPVKSDEAGAPTASDGGDGGSANREYFPDFGVRGVLHPALGTLPEDATRVLQLIQIAGRSADEPINGEIWFYLPQLRAF